MELKLVEEEKSQNTGLRFEDGDEKTASQDKAAGTYNQNIEKNPWDFDMDTEPVVLSSIKDTIPAEVPVMEEENIVIKVSKILLYIAFLGFMGIYIALSVGEKADIMKNILKYAVVSSLCEGMICIDAILVNIFYKRKISLIFWSWLFPIVYPVKRNKHVQGHSGYGGWLGVGMLVTGIIFAVNLMVAYMQYGMIMAVEDDTVRHAAVEIFDQPIADGVTLGNKLNSNTYPLAAEIQQQGNEEGVIFSVLGGAYVDNNTFMLTGQKNIETQLLFVKNAETSEYELVAASLNGEILNSYYLDYYKNNVLLK